MKKQNDESILIEYSGSEEQEQYGDIRCVILKFINDKELPYGEDVVKHLDGWAEIEKSFPGITIAPLCRTTSAEELKSLVEQARKLDPDYNVHPATFLNLYGVDYPENTDVKALASRLGSAWEFAEYAYAEGEIPLPPAVNPGNAVHRGIQGYLDPAPIGIDAEAAWQVLGGDGAGVRFLDIERGWNVGLGHEDLPPIIMVSGKDEKAFWQHGTAVLGIVAGQDNNRGIVGVAPHVADVRVVSQLRSIGKFNTHDAIVKALTVMNAGDVLLLEAHARAAKFPIEWYPHIWDDIDLAASLGIIVIEAAGNGGHNLDNTNNGRGEKIWKQGSQFQDSRAIMVGAADVKHNSAKPVHTNRGSRIDCFAWGTSVVTTLWDSNAPSSKNMYMSNFDGTSAAAAIVAGAAISLQGIALANPNVNGGMPFTPSQMRDLLSANTGTPSNDPANDRIGVMPNLKAILAGLNLP